MIGTMHVRNTAVGLATLCLLAVPAARAQSSDAGAARQEIGELKRTVEQLNTRIESLERQLAEQPKPTPPDTSRTDTPEAASAPALAPAISPATALQEHWRGIEHGMSVDAVETLLGRPQRTIKMESKTVWYYAYPDIGNGSVVFVQDDGVIDWQQPPFSVWW